MTNIPNWTLGDRLAKARAFADISRPEMAHRMGVSPQSISNYETGQRTPRISQIVKWARLTHVPLDWLLQDLDPGDDDPETFADQPKRRFTCISPPLHLMPRTESRTRTFPLDSAA